MLTAIRNPDWRSDFELCQNAIGVSFKRYGEDDWHHNLYRVDTDFPFVLEVQNVYYLSYSPDLFCRIRGFLRNIYSILRGKGRIQAWPRACSPSHFEQSQQEQRNPLSDGAQAETVFSKAAKIQIVEDFTNWVEANTGGENISQVRYFLEKYRLFLLK